MVLIYVEVSIGFDFEVEASVFGEEFQHVVEEADAGRYFVAALAFDGQGSGDPGFFGASLDGGFSHRAVTPSSSLMSAITATAPSALKRANSSSRRRPAGA